MNKELPKMNSPSEDSDASRNSCCTTAVRVPLFILNLITWICGGALIGLGIWVVMTDNEYKHFAENKNSFIVFISFATFLFAAGIFGACGALAGNKLILQMYFTILCLVFCGLLGLVVFGVVQKTLVHDIVKKSWNKTTDETRIFIQEKFHCCGIGDNITLYSPNSNRHESCFVNETTREAKQNCLAKLVDWFKEHQLIIAAFASSIMLVMILLMVCSCCLIHKLTSKRGMKRSRVCPIVVNENQMTNFTEERPRQSEIEDDMTPIEEIGEGSGYSKRNEKGKQLRRHQSGTRQSWAKRDGIMLQ